MNLHEYQGKEILSKHGVRVQRGYLAHTVEESISSAKKIYNLTNTPCFIIKAQIHAGGRGKGGGIKLAKNMQEVEQYASDILGMNLITPQTSKHGKIEKFCCGRVSGSPAASNALCHLFLTLEEGAGASADISLRIIYRCCPPTTRGLALGTPPRM